VGDLALSEPFLRRFADRVILQSFEDNFRVIVADEPDPKHDHDAKEGEPASSTTATVPDPAARAQPPAGAQPGAGFATLRIVLGVVCVVVLLAVAVLRRRRA
jgi:hypothetical protein